MVYLAERCVRRDDPTAACAVEALFEKEKKKIDVISQGVKVRYKQGCSVDECFKYLQVITRTVVPDKLTINGVAAFCTLDTHRLNLCSRCTLYNRICK